MALAAYQLRVAHTLAQPSKTDTAPVQAYLVTPEAPTAVEAANYFDSAAIRIPKGSIIDAVMSFGGTPVTRKYVVTSNDGTTVVVDRAEDSDSGQAGRAVVPTADGLTTGLILDTDSFVIATSANADHILTLPSASAATVGREIDIWVVASTNCELRTPASSNQTINNVDSDGSQEALLTHSQFYTVKQVTATGWLLFARTALGAVATAIIPD